MKRYTLEVCVEDNMSPELRKALTSTLWEAMDQFCVETHGEFDCPVIGIMGTWDDVEEFLG